MSLVPDYGPLVDVPYLGTAVRAFRDRPRSLSAVVAAAADRWPERVAVVAPAGTLTYAELDVAVSAAAAGLLRAGVAPGDRFAVALGHDLPLLLVPFAASRLGATALLLSTTLAPGRWARQLDTAGVEVLVADDSTAPRAKAAVTEALRAVAVVGVDGVLLGAAPAAAPADVDADEDRPVAHIATSGTTGIPKATTVTSRGLVHAALAYIQLLRLRGDGSECSLVVLPLHYIGPLSAQTTTMPLVGGRVVIPQDPSPAAAARLLDAHRVTHLDAVPAWLGQYVREADPVEHRHLRTLIYGGAPMPQATAVALADRHPRLDMLDVWGLSETHGPATATRFREDLPVGTVGRPLPGVEVRAIDGDGRPAAHGRVGELCVRGANVTPGYLGDAATSAAVIRDGWLRTGDLGTVADDGTVRVLDRAKDVILRGGSNVFSVEVEQVLAAAPGVVEAAAFGVPDALGGEAVAAAVVLVPGVELDARALRRRVADEVGVHAAPRRIAAVERLPRNPTGKIDKAALRQELRA